MVSSKNPYSFMALAKLQSIRDAKMKEQAGQPMPPPMSEQIPQQLAQLASGRQTMQQPMQPQQQPMPQQPMQPPMQQPMQPQGIASIGGEPNGAGGGMVSFTDGGGVRRFAEPNGVQLVTEEPENLGAVRLGFKPQMGFPRISPISPTPPLSDEVIERNNAIKNARRTIAELNPPGWAARKEATNNNQPDPLIQFNKDLTEAKANLNSLLNPIAAAPAVASAEKPAARSGDASGSDAGITRLNNQPTGGSLNPAPIYKELTDKLGPLQTEVLDAQAAGITAFTNAQGAMAPYYDPKRLAEFTPTDEARETSRQTKQTELEKAFPNPYTKTANALELLQKNLENSEANTFNKALFKASLALMGSKSPKFFQAAAESGLVGVEDYGRMQEANQKQRMALMNADTALATAQDSRKRGLYDQSAKQVSESLQFKKDAFLAERDATLEKGRMAIALEGEKAKRPALKIQQAQDLFSLQHGLYTDKFKLAEFNQRGAQIKAMSTPEMGKAIEWAARNPQYAGQIYDEKSRAMFGTIIKEAMDASQKDQVTPPEQKKIVFDATVKSALDAYAKQYPRPMTFGK